MEELEVAQKGSRKPHRKSRLGCGNCKKRRVKCNEAKPTCSNCVRHCIKCDFDTGDTLGPTPQEPQPKLNRKFVASGYESGTHSSGPTDIRSRPTETISSSRTSSTNLVPPATPGLNRTDLEIWHHYLMSTCHTFLGDGLEFWQKKLPEIGFQNNFVLHLILALSAFHLARCRPMRNEEYISLAEKYHTVGLHGAATLISSMNAENCEAIYSSAILICFCNLAKGPEPGEFIAFSTRGDAQWLALLRGVRSITESQLETLNSGILAPIVQESVRKIYVGESQHASPDYKPHLNELRSFISENKDLLQPFSGVYLKALDNLSQSFAAVYGNVEAHERGDDPYAQIVFAWLYRASDDYIRCLQEKQPIALVIFSFYAVLLQSIESQWFMEGWVQHVIKGVQSFLGDDLQHWLRWPIKETKMIID